MIGIVISTRVQQCTAYVVLHVESIIFWPRHPPESAFEPFGQYQVMGVEDVPIFSPISSSISALYNT